MDNFRRLDRFSDQIDRSPILARSAGLLAAVQFIDDHLDAVALCRGPTLQEPTSEQPSEHVPAPDTSQDLSGDGGVSPRAIRWMMAAVAVVAVIVGLSLGMATSSVTSPTDSGYKVSCGSPWSPDASDAAFQDELTQAIGREQYGFNFNPGYADKCEQAHGARGGWGNRARRTRSADPRWTRARRGRRRFGAAADTDILTNG